MRARTKEPVLPNFGCPPRLRSEVRAAGIESLEAWRQANLPPPPRPRRRNGTRKRTGGFVSQGFVKSFARAGNRSPRDRPILDAVVTSGSHRICTYPRGR